MIVTKLDYEILLARFGRPPESYEVSGHVLNGYMLSVLGSMYPRTEWAWPDNLCRNDQNGKPRRVDFARINADRSRCVAIETKASCHDLRNELRNPDKYQPWLDYATEFWYLIPVEVYSVAISEPWKYRFPQAAGIMTLEKNNTVKRLREPHRRVCQPHHFPEGRWMDPAGPSLI